MDDEREKPDVTPAPPLSAEFLSGGTAAGLEKIRARLLDLTNRNRLLNFRHTSASSIRIVDADLDAVFARLVNGEEIPFRPVPEPKLPPIEPENEDAVAKPLAADHAESLGWYTAYDLTTPSRHNADSRSRAVDAGGTRPARQFLHDLIKDARAANPHGLWADHLRQALDYRTWHRFSVERRQNDKWEKLTKRRYGTGSGGEKALMLTVPQMAAAAAHYRSAAPHAPRLILLDEVFVGIDSKVRAKCMGLLEAFDLDFVMTSEREWGAYPTIRGLAIYQLRPLIEIRLST